MSFLPLRIENITHATGAQAHVHTQTLYSPYTLSLFMNPQMTTFGADEKVYSMYRGSGALSLSMDYRHVLLQLYSTVHKRKVTTE